MWSSYAPLRLALQGISAVKHNDGTSRQTSRSSDRVFCQNVALQPCCKACESMLSAAERHHITMHSHRDLPPGSCVMQPWGRRAAHNLAEHVLNMS